MNEKRLLQALKKGDKVAFAAIFNKYAPDIFNFSLDLTKNKNDAEEILQETFVKLWEYRENIDTDRSVKNYIISIAKNTIYNVLKHRLVEHKYLSVKPSPSDPSDTERVLYQGDLRYILSRSFNKLTPHQKKIMTLRTEGLNNEEIADLLYISQRTVESHITRAYKHLRTDLNYLKDIILCF